MYLGTIPGGATTPLVHTLTVLGYVPSQPDIIQHGMFRRMWLSAYGPRLVYSTRYSLVDPVVCFFLICVGSDALAFALRVPLYLSKYSTYMYSTLTCLYLGYSDITFNDTLALPNTIINSRKRFHLPIHLNGLFRGTWYSLILNCTIIKSMLSKLNSEYPN